MKAEDAIGHERDDREENRPGDPEGDADGVVDIAPVSGDRRPPPRAVDVKQHRADRDQKQYECATAIPRSFLPLKATETNQRAEHTIVLMADFTCAIAVLSCLAHLTGRDI